jgi:hypothetical protein
MPSRSSHHGLGRRAAPDPRDADYPLRAVLPTPPPTRTRSWPAYRWRLNQGAYSECVEFAWTHFLLDSPTTHALPDARAAFSFMWADTHPDGDGLPGAGALYKAAQQVDEWPGDAYDGTSVRAGAKVLQAAGLIGDYRWTQTEADLVDCLLTQGPVVVGTDWPEGWFEPDARGRVGTPDASAGGHAWKVDGIHLDGSSRMFGRGVPYVRAKNQWRNPDGELWGHGGFFYARLDDVAALIFDRDGEACRALEPVP